MSISRILQIRGVTLIELLVAVALLAMVGLMFGLFAPKASEEYQIGRLRWTANQLAADTLQEIKLKPYALLDLTELNYATAFGGTLPPNGCNCTSADFAYLPILSMKTTNNTTFATQACVSLTDVTGQSHCQSFGDTRLKTVFVRVSWKWKNELRFVTMEGTVSNI